MKSIYLVTLFLLLFGCKKDDPIKHDYRENYLGTFKFSSIKSHLVMCYDTIPPCINGWKIVSKDSCFYTNKIELIDSNKIKIDIWNDILGYDVYDNIISQTFLPVISKEGIISFVDSINIWNIEGYYIGYDTLIMEVIYRPGIGGYETFNIKGVRIK